MPDDRARKRALNLSTLWARPKANVGATPSDVVHTENKWKLLRYRARPEGIASKTPVLLIPSLINRHYVLDLLPGRSFTEYLVGKGHDVYTIDWGTPGPEDRYLTFDDVCDGYVGRAVRHAARSSQRNKTHVLGYCLGGTMAAIHTAARPAHVASLVALAAPIRFLDAGVLGEWTRTPTFDVDALVRACGNVPWQLMEAAFSMLRPTLPLAKAVGLADRAYDDEFLNSFLAVEKWGSDNVSFPGEFYRRYIEELYRKDALVNGTFRLSGEKAQLERIVCPTMAITFEHDAIVPAPCATALLELVGAVDKVPLHLPGGHVGAVVARGAVKSLWPKISEFFSARDAEAPSARRAKPKLGK